MNQNLDRQIRDYIVAMPSLPTSVSKVMELCNNPHINPADLNHVISLDPVLTGRVLKLLNSAYYGLSRRITSLARAIIMLGVNTVKNLVLSSTVIGALGGKKISRGLDMEGFWRHSLCVGVSSKFLARERGIAPDLREEYFTAGFLHDIGKIPLNYILAKEYLLTLKAADTEKISLYRAEDSTLGLNHCAVGAMIADSWKLTGGVGDAVMYHHQYAEKTDSPYRDILFNVAVANYFAVGAEIGFSGDRWAEKIPPLVWELLGIGPDMFDRVAAEVGREIEKAEIFLML
ncbi:MAG: HDOD domain-containing protein [Treponema sp.]|jgi:HD-like signal output (HDOD) protein|nr:HDOD domain-containing protein [Treponema sp.]